MANLKKKIVSFFPASRSTPRYYTFFLISAKNPKSEEKNGICFLVIHWINNEPKKTTNAEIYKQNIHLLKITIFAFLISLALLQ